MASSKTRRRGQPSGQARQTSQDSIEADPVEGGERRKATVYDVVAGRVGVNGFLTETQIQSARVQPLSPEEYLLRRWEGQGKSLTEKEVGDGYSHERHFLNTHRPTTLEFDDDHLPDSDLLRAIHSYAAEFYAHTTEEKDNYDLRSMDASALLAMGILLEEASREILGKTGDMVLVEPESLQDGLPESKRVQHQIRGRVIARKLPELSSDGSSETDASEDAQQPRKRRRPNDRTRR